MGQVDESCRRRFEATRLAGEDTPIEAFLPDPENESFQATLEELVLIELEVRHKAWSANGGGLPPSIGDYAERFPQLAAPKTRERLEQELAWLDRRPAHAVDRYVVHERVGEGAFANVWRAHDPKLERDVALKIPKGELSGDAALLERVRREASAAARLDHPGIVSVFAVGEHEGRPFYASELVAGPTLAAHFASAGSSPDETARLVAQVCDAVAYAHELGVVHRDIKPSNILMHAVRGPVLTDFGLARLGSAANVLTREGDLLGTPAYMAPEQARGDAHGIDGRTDVYALGVLLYEGLSGRRPFDRSSTAATVQAVLTEDPPPLGGVPPDLETICLKAMAREPDRRYGSARALSDDLGRYLARKPIAARRTTAAGRVALWMRRHPGMTALAGAGLVAVSIALAWGYLGIRAERDELRKEQANTKRNLYRALTRDAQAIIAAKRAGWPEQTLARVRDAAAVDTPHDIVMLRDLAIESITTHDPTLSEVARLQPIDGPAQHIDVASDGTQAIVFTKTHLRVRSLADGAVVRAAPFKADGVRGLALHPSASWFVIAFEDGRLQSWSVSPLARMAETTTKPLTAIAMHPEGAVLAAAREDGRVELRRCDGASLGTPTRTLEAHDGAVRSLAFSPQGTRLVTGGDDNRMRMWHWKHGRMTRDVADMPSPVTAVAARGMTLAGSSDVRWSPKEATERATPIGTFPDSLHGSPIRWLGYLGTWLVSIGTDGSFGIVEANKTLLRDACHASRVLDVAYLPQSCEIVTSHADGLLIRRRIGGGTAGRAWVAHHACAFRPGTHELITDHAVYGHAGKGLVERPFAVESLTALAVDHRRSELIGVTHDGRVIHRRDTPPFDVVRAWPSGLDAATAVAVREDALAIGAHDGRVWLGSLEGERPLGAIHDLARGGILRVAWTDAGALLALAEGGLFRVGRDDRPVSVSAEAGIIAALSAEAGRIAWSRGLGDVVVHEGATSRVLGGHENRVRDVALSRDGRWLASTDGKEVFVRALPDGRIATRTAAHEAEWLRFDQAGRLLVSGINFGVLDAATGRWLGRAWMTVGYDAASSSDASTIFYSDRRAGLCAWPVTALSATGFESLGSTAWLAPPQQLVPGGHAHATWGVATSPDGRWFATCDHTGAVKLWSARTRVLAADLAPPGDEMAWRVAFSADSKLLAASIGTAIHLFDVPTRMHAGRLDHDKLVSSLAFDPLQPRVLTTTGKTLTLWDLTTKRVLATHEAPANAVVYHPEGHTVAIAYKDGTLGIHMAKRLAGNPEPTQRIKAHAGGASAVVYNRKGTLLASGGPEGRVVLHDAASGERLCSFRATVNIRTLSFSSDDRWLAASSYVLGGRSWDLEHVRRVLRELKIDWD